MFEYSCSDPAMVDRPDHVSRLQRLLWSYPVVAILGARQVGKTTLARELTRSHRGPVTSFDLEDPATLARLQDPGYALDSLTGLVIRQLAPWHENLAKRQVKSLKVYLRDAGLLHSLLGVPGQRELLGHPKVGASWEGFIIEQIICQLKLAPSECYFWRTYQGAELDLLVVQGNRRIGFEIKHASAPQLSPSMRTAVNDLNNLTMQVAANAC